MATADLITAFLNNEMSPENERGFLLTVASSDTLRLELKSHVMLDRMFVAQSERAEVPEAIRGMIFAEAGVSIDGPRPADPPSNSGAIEAGRRLSRSFMSRFVRGGMLVLVATSGFAAGYFSGQSGDPVASQAPSATAPMSVPTSTAPAVTTPALDEDSPSVVDETATPTETAVRSTSGQTNTTLSAGNRSNTDRSSVTARRNEPAPTTNAGTPQQVTDPAADPVQNPGTPSGVTVEPNVRKSTDPDPAEKKDEQKEEPRMP